MGIEFKKVTQSHYDEWMVGELLLAHHTLTPIMGDLDKVRPDIIHCWRFHRAELPQEAEDAMKKISDAWALLVHAQHDLKIAFKELSNQDDPSWVIAPEEETTNEI